MKAAYIRFLKLLVLILAGAIPLNYLNCQEGNNNSLPQFLFPKFARGIIKMKDNRKLTAIMNFQTVDQEMLFQQGDKYMVVSNPDQIDSIYLQNRKFVYIPDDKVFFEVVSSGKVVFYIEHKSKYVEQGTTTAYGIKSPTVQTFNVSSVQGGNQVRHIDLPEKVKVEPSPVCWVKINGEMKRFISERQLIKLFPEKEADLKQFFSKNKLEIKTFEGLMQAGNYINSII